MTDQRGDESSARLNEALAAYYAAIEEGQEPDRQALLEGFPELMSFFPAKADFEQQAGPLLSGSPALADPVRVGGYEILGEIGRGGMGVVYRARHRELGRLVALKMIRAATLATPEDVRRFRSEAALVATLDHPHIVPVYEVGEPEGVPFFAMRLIEGGNLAGR